MDALLEKLDRYDPAWALSPVFRGTTMYNESVVLVGRGDGECAAPLLYVPTEILSVRDYSLKRTYLPGRDFTYRDGLFRRLPSSPLPFFPEEEFTCEAPTPAEFVMNYAFGGHMRVGYADVFQHRVVNVTYTHADRWPWEPPRYKGDRLPGTVRALKQGRPLTVVFYGDSVMSGDDVTSHFNSEPFTPPWPRMVCDALGERFGAPVTLVNAALGGTRLEWGLENLEERVIAHQPDLLFVGFGSNDRFSPAEYKDNMARLLERVRTACPGAECVVVDPMTPNRHIARGDDGYMWNVFQYYYALKNLELEEELEGVAALEIMRPHLRLQEVKRFHDMTANNINHPNDWLYRVMAQIALELFREP